MTVLASCPSRLPSPLESINTGPGPRPPCSEVPGRPGVGAAAMPSANGREAAPSANGAATPPANSQQAGGRDARGRFAAGNAGGPGNPFARQVARLRQALLDSVTAADMAAVARRLLTLALEGNVQAGKLLLAYTIGKPQPAADPDRLDQDEWQGYKETSTMLAESPGLLQAPEPAFPLECVRLARPAVTHSLRQATAHALLHPEEQEAQEAKKAEECLRLLNRPAPPWADDFFGPPSPNGRIGGGGQAPKRGVRT